MKNRKSIFLGILLLFILSAAALSNPRVIAVINHADWCSTCVGNGERAMEVFVKNNQSDDILFLVNDLTNEQTKQESARQLGQHGLQQPMRRNRSTGVVYFFDAGSKKLINKISVAKSSEEIATAMQTARDEVE
jgi:hypothetical protein